jgi:SET domain-containing protein
MKSLHPSSLRIRHKSARYLLRIGRSRIHRYGVFALEDIPVRCQVIEYTGRRLSLDQAAKLKPPHDDYLVRPGQSRLINGSIGGSGAEFINHSCNPNLTWRHREGSLFFYSRRPIRAGEELTMCFSYPIKARRVPCSCGTRKCRKTLRYLIK